MEMFMEALQNFGFPVACVFFLAWYIYRLQEQHRIELKEIMTQHKQETDKLTEAINSNTMVMQKLVDKIGE